RKRERETDSLLCPVCLSVFTKPVSIPCGHNFCMNCITEYWSTLSVLQCPLCKEMFYTRPLLRVNPQCWFQSLCKCTVYKIWGKLQSAETEEVTWTSDETFLSR
uniref:RING-type domain-containing protein n=1 Tax=Maylandia zebra TaxID=106582 RepID=A0A3P9DQ86_9CICH